MAIKPKLQLQNAVIYSFALPVDSATNNYLIAKVMYKGKYIQGKKVAIGNRLITIQKQFTYVNTSTNKIGDIQLPFYVPANRYYWILTTDMLTEQAATDNSAFCIQIESSNKNKTAKYFLPEKFDIISNNGFYIDYLSKMKKTMRDSILLLHSWTLSLSTSPSTAMDTTITYSIRKTLPKGIAKLVSAELSTQPSGQVFSFDKGYLYNNQLYIPIHNAQLKCDNIFITTNGNMCATKPCKGHKKIMPCNYQLLQYGRIINISINIEK